MTQAVIVIPVFLLLWMGLVALHHLYAARLQAQTDAHGLSLTMAAAGECGTDVTTIDQIDPDSSANTHMEDDSSKMISGVAGCQPFAWSHSKGAAQVTAGDIPAVFGGPTKTTKAENLMMCNMKPVEGLADLVAGLVTELLGID